MCPGWIIVACKPKYVAKGRCFKLFLKKDADFIKFNFPEYAYEIKEFSDRDEKKALDYAEADIVEHVDNLRRELGEESDYTAKGTFFLKGNNTPIVELINISDRGIDYASDTVKRLENEIEEKVSSGNNYVTVCWGAWVLKACEIAAFKIELID